MQNKNIFKKRKFITKNILLKMLNTFNVSTQQNAILYTIFYFVFAVFFRVNEFI